MFLVSSLPLLGFSTWYVIGYWKRSALHRRFRMVKLEIGQFELIESRRREILVLSFQGKKHFLATKT